MAEKDIRTGIIGAGFIAGWHADTLKACDGVVLAAVCDTSMGAATALAGAHGADAFGDLDAMIAGGGLDAVHVLTPPDSHHDIAIKCLDAGLHVLVEKPVAVSAEQTVAMGEAAQRAGKVLAAGHNFLGVPGYVRLSEAVAGGRLGKISSAEINWCFPMPPLRSGPYGLWLMRQPRNLLLELGPHLFAFAVDLFGPLDIKHLEVSQPITLPDGSLRHQGWRILAEAGGTDIVLTISLAETYDDRSVTLRGSSGMARLDYAADTLVIRSENTADLVINPLRRQLSEGRQVVGAGLGNAWRQLTSLNQKSPYALSFQGTFRRFYGAISRGKPLDQRFGFTAAQNVMQGIDDALAKLPDMPVPARPEGTPKPSVMVIGGTGFIGRALTRALVAQGKDVRVLSRGRHGPFDDIADHVETIGVSLRDKDGLTRAMEGIDTVFNLARSLDGTWEEALRTDVAISDTIAGAAEAAGVRRFIYTGTIASYDMSDRNRTITEDIAFPGDMSNRNIYSRSKAECEKRLLKMHAERGFPVVIARPGIVVGAGGPLQHWGLGWWHGPGAVKIWGPGTNTLPFVLIDDVADGLIRMMETDGIEGESYNLVAGPMLSAQAYFDAIHRRLGAKINARPGSLHAFFAADAVKYGLKRALLRRKGLTRPSLFDWKSRAHFSPFDNSKPKRDLDWQPQEDRERFLQAAVDEAGLFGI